MRNAARRPILEFDRNLREYPMTDRKLLNLALLAAFTLGSVACENKGPLQQAGEEVDEAVDTLKNGRESTANKLDDAADELREGAQQAVEEVKK
jgi:predicted small lipoprotein YifL